MKNFMTFREDLASGRPAKKPVSSNLLKQRAVANQKALDTGFMKLTPKERAKESKRMSEAKDMCSCDCDCKKAVCESCGKPKKLDEISNELVKKVAHKRAVNTSMELSKAHGDTRSPDFKSAAEKQKKNQSLRFKRGATAIGKMRNESARDNYDPEISDKRTKEKLKKAGLPPESPKVMETILRDVFEGKKKGMDGKACWKGYKLQGTKKKGNRTVDNCVPMSEQEEIKPHKMFKGDKVVMAKNTAEHEKLKKQGYTHDDPKTKKVEEAKKPVVHSTKPDSLKTVKIKYNKPIGVKVTNIGPGGKETVVKNTMQEQQMQIVTNLDFNESLGMLVTRGLNKVRDSIKSAEKNTGYKVDPRKNNTPNPVSGSNIAKRLASQKKRK